MMMLTELQRQSVRNHLTAKRLLLMTSICGFIIISQTIDRIILRPNTSNLKYILMWTSTERGPFKYWKTEREEFKENNCTFTNCFLTRIRFKLHLNISNFDAVIFNGRSLRNATSWDLPSSRPYHQKYIFLNLESSDNQPICSALFDEFFNWTATYKLNSDIIFPYMLIKNMNSDDVGPKVDMTWVDDMSELNEKLLQTLKTKTKAVAWFVSHYNTRSKREKYVKKLKNALKKLNLTLDIYSKYKNGALRILRYEHNKAESLLKNTYYFYLAFENSFAEDYITEKVTTALLNDVVPVLYGGANYSRFLPPGSYIDARKHEPNELASVMARLIRTPAAYQDFFRWKNHYTYHRPNSICSLCAAMNNQTMLETRTVYTEFRRWWNPDYAQRCKDKTWGS